jgi:polyether ionophore transport system permease protein
MTTLAGSGLLARSMLRRDRARIAVWVIAVGGLVATAASSVKRLYPTQADLDQAARASADSAVARAFKGPALALQTLGGQVAFQIVVFGALAVALMSVLTVSRLTRGEEEDGRLELVRALPVGRRAPLAAALLVAAAMDVAVGVLAALGLLAEGLPAGGSVLIGAAFVGVGSVFCALTAVTAQITENTRVASGIAGAILAASFVLRAIGDVGNGAASWLSPIGWAQKTRPYAGDVAWPLLLSVVAAVVLAMVAVCLVDRRDVGAGLVAPRPGPATASAALATPGGLARRLQRGGALWWAVGILLLGVGYGSITSTIDQFVGDNQAIQDVIARRGGSLVDSFLATSLLILALVAGGFAVQSTLRLRGEETTGRTEVVLATPVSRARWMASHLVIAFGWSALALFAGGVGLGLPAAIATGDIGLLPRVAVASLAYVPAVWVLTAVAVALFGLLPRWTALAWAPLAVALVVGMFGTLLDLPRAVLDLSPFEQTPSVPAADWDAVPLVALVVVAAALVAVGLTAFRRRNIPA